MSEPTSEQPRPEGDAQRGGVERGGADEVSGAPLTDTEIETSKKPEDRDSDV